MADWPVRIAGLLHEDAEDLYEHAPCGYLSIVPDGIVAKVNETFLRWIGFTRREIVGSRRFIDLLTVGGRIFYETHFQPLLQMQGFVREIAFDVVRRDAQPLPVLVNAVRREQQDGLSVIRITLFDATDRRCYERELLAARDRAEKLSRIKTELISMISHDLRAPLSAILTSAALLDKTGPRADQAKYVRVLQSSAGHALELVNSVLDLERLESGRVVLREREFGLRELATEITTSARAAATQKTDLAVRMTVLDDVPERVLGDSFKLGQVLANLMMNAVKFTERGMVSLVISVRELLDQAVTVDVRVSDTGIGIPADRLPYIFDEFTQASDDIADRYGGTGLGLAISRKLLQLHGSDLHVSSTVGQGTTFSFLLTLKTAASRVLPCGQT
jgi:PAS domain S-box-containing protein